MAKQILITIFAVMTVFPLSADDNLLSGQIITWALAEENWVPIYEGEGESVSDLQGFWPDLIREIFVQRLQMIVKVKRTPWVRAQREIKLGESDLMITIPTEERKKYSLASKEPVMSLTMQIFTYRGHEKMEEIQNIESVNDIIQLDLTPVTSFGNGWHEQHIDAYGVQTQFVHSEESLPKVLANRRADILIDSPLTMGHQIRQLGLSSQIVLTDVILDHTDFHLLMSRKSELADYMDVFNNALKEMIDDGTLDSLYRKYIVLE